MVKEHDMSRSFREVKMAQAQEVEVGDVFSIAGSSWQIAESVETDGDGQTKISGRRGPSGAPNRHELSALELVRIQVVV